MANWKRVLFSSGGGGDDAAWGLSIYNSGGSNVAGEQLPLGADSSGNIFMMDGNVSGYGNSAYGPIVYKITPDGALDWERRLYISGNSLQGNFLVMDGDDPIVVCRTFDNLIGSNNEPCAIKLNGSNGSTIYYEHYGKNSNTYTIPSMNQGCAGIQSDGTLVIGAKSGARNFVLVRADAGTGAIEATNGSNMGSWGTNVNPYNVQIGGSNKIIVGGDTEHSGSPSRRGMVNVFSSNASSLDWAGGVDFTNSSYYAQGNLACMDDSGNVYHSGRPGGSGLIGHYTCRFPSGGGSLDWSDNYYEVYPNSPLCRAMITDSTDLFQCGYGGNPSVGVSAFVSSKACSNGNWNYHYLLRIGSGTGNNCWTKGITFSSSGNSIIAAGIEYSANRLWVMQIPKSGITVQTYGSGSDAWNFTNASRTSSTAPIYNNPYSPTISNEGLTDKTDLGLNNIAATGTFVETLVDLSQ